VSLQPIKEVGVNIRSEHLRARSRWREGGDGGTLTDCQDGVNIVLKYEGSSRSSDFRSVHLDGHLFARETETIPWNIFKPITVGYTVFIDLQLETAQWLVAQVKSPAGKIRLEEEWYPSENGPMRYYAHCDTLDDVISLWKVWKKTFLDLNSK
jgi:hypothetical protein